MGVDIGASMYPTRHLRDLAQYMRGACEEDPHLSSGVHCMHSASKWHLPSRMLKRRNTSEKVIRTVGEAVRAPTTFGGAGA